MSCDKVITDSLFLPFTFSGYSMSRQEIKDLTELLLYEFGLKCAVKLLTNYVHAY